MNMINFYLLHRFVSYCTLEEQQKKLGFLQEF